MKPIPPEDISVMFLLFLLEIVIVVLTIRQLWSVL